MKKALCVLVVAVLTLSLLSVAASALTFNGQEYCDVEFEIKKADPANVVKDGVISAGEYERLEIDLNDQTTPLDINYCSYLYFDTAVEFMKTLEYYFSWDEVHGFNIAVKCRPVAEFFRQINTQPTGDPPQDNFLSQLGFQLGIDQVPIRPDSVDFFYYCIARNTETGEYLKGHYESEQLGITKAYDPTPGKDFVIEYPDDGTVILEWSVPFSDIQPGAGAGDEIYFSLGACNGICEVPLDSGDTGEMLNESIISVGLGDYSYGTKCVWNSSSHCIGTLSSEAVSGANRSGGNDETGGNGGGTQVVTEIETVLTTDEEGNTVVETRVVPKNVPASDSNKTNTGKRTGDPMIIIAAVSAVSACGVVILKKKH